MPCDGDGAISLSPTHYIPPDSSKLQTEIHSSTSFPSFHRPHQSPQSQTPRLDKLESQDHLSKQPFFSRLTILWSRSCAILHPITDCHQRNLTKAVVLTLILETFPTQMYLFFLLRIPMFYGPCVDQIIKEADKTLLEIKNMAPKTHDFVMQAAFEPSTAPPAYKKLMSSWDSFIDSLIQEWKTFNTILAILTVLQIQIAQTAEESLIRCTALLSLMCALTSLLFGGTYIVRFGSMRQPWKAIEWAQEAKKSQTYIWWNVPIMLAMPAIWLTWFILFYILCIMFLVWRSGMTSTTPPGIANTGLLVIRIAITLVLGIGVIYGFLIITTFRQYSNVAMEKAWNRRIDRWIEEREQATFPQTVLVPACVAK